MKPNEKKPEEVFRIINKETGNATGSYSRAYCDEFDFRSVSEARHANCHGMFEDKTKFKIAKYRVTYELIDDDCDGAEGFVAPQKTILELYAIALGDELARQVGEQLFPGRG